MLISLKNNQYESKIKKSLGYQDRFIINHIFIRDFSCKEVASEIDPKTTSTRVKAETYSYTNFVATDWRSQTHSKEGVPNFSLVFDDT